MASPASIKAGSEDRRRCAASKLRDVGQWVTIAIALIVVTLSPHGAQPRSRVEFERLREALGNSEYRPVAGALSGNLPYRPFRQNRLPLQLRATAAEIASHAAERTHVRGVASLVLGNIARSAGELRQVAEHTPTPDTWSDLAAAYIALADENHSGEAAVDAYAAATGALKLDPQHSPAIFNRMLALERLGLTAEAARDARLFLTLAPSAGWADEANRIANSLPLSTPRDRWTSFLPKLKASVAAHDDQAVREMVRKFPQYARTWGEGVFLGEWADAVLAHDQPRAKAAFEMADAIGSILVQTTGDALLHDACDAIRTADHAQLDLLADAHRLFRDGRLAHRDHDHPRAESKFREAVKEFREAGSPMALLAQYYVGSSLYMQFRVSESAQLLTALDRDLRQRHATYRALGAQVGWERGFCLLVNGSFSDALDTFTESATIFRALREQENEAIFEAWGAETLDYIDDPDAAWRYRSPALRELAANGNEARILGVVTTAADDRARDQQWFRARALYDIALNISLRLRQAEVTPYVLIRRSVVEAQLNDVQRAREDINEAYVWVQRLKDPSTRRREEAELAWGRALQRDMRPGEALTQIDRAIAYYDETAPAFLPTLLLDRARIHRQRGDDASARRDLERGIELLETNRTSVRDLSQRAMMFASSRGLFQEAIADALQRNDVAAAFNLSERARARAILDGLQLATTATTPLLLDSIQKRISDHAALVVFVRSRQRMNAIVVRRTDVVRFDLGEAASIDGAAIRLSAAMDEGRVANALDLAANVHAKVVRPIREALEGVRVVVWIPEGALRGIPFAALYDRDHDRFVIEDFVTTEAASASVALTASERSGVSPAAPALVVGAGSFDRERFTLLDLLPETDREARAIASVRRQSRLLTGVEATPTEILRQLPVHAIFHFAGHVIDGRTAGDAEMILSRDPSGQSTLDARTLAQMQLPLSRLVVLSACRSASKGGHGDGPESMASAFLLAGVPTVIATPWPVDDRAASSFAERFHRELELQPDPASALQDVLRADARDVQHRPRSPVLWASFVAIGGSTLLDQSAVHGPGPK